VGECGGGQQERQQEHGEFIKMFHRCIGFRFIS
jgi:hypothetical protein